MLQRRDLLQRQMELLMTDLAFVPLYATSDLYGVRRDLEWRPRLDTYLEAREMRLRDGGGR